MAERDSRRTDARALRRGVALAVPVAVAARVAFWLFALAFNPVLSDIYRGVRVPGGLPVTAAAALVGAACGWFRVRDSRRYVAATGDAATGEGRAIRIARANANVDRSGNRAEVHAAVQRWTPDLLAGGDPLPHEGGEMT